MSPIGPESPGVYWVRRAVALLVILVLLLLLWWLFFGRGGEAAVPDAAPEPTQTAAPTPTQVPTSAAPTPEPTSTEITDCVDEDVLVEEFAEEAIYPEGSTPTLTLTVTNLGTRPCARNEHTLAFAEGKLVDQVEVVRHEARHPLLEVTRCRTIPGSSHCGASIPRSGNKSASLPRP